MAFLNKRGANMKTELRFHLRQSCLELKEILVLRWKIFFLTNLNNLT
nr:MAG TPA: hypothetical protein [Caudoviricetes sp.]